MDTTTGGEVEARNSLPAEQFTLAFWKAYKTGGASNAYYVGLLENSKIPVRISRVTTCNVFVDMGGQKRVPVHPNDLRPVNPNAIAWMRRQGLI